MPLCSPRGTSITEAAVLPVPYFLTAAPVLCRKQVSKPCSKKQTFSTRDKRVSSRVVSAIFNPLSKSTSDGVRHRMKHRKNDGENNRRIFKGRFCAIQGWKDRLQILQGFFFLQLLFFTTVAAYLFPSLCYGLDRQKEACPSHSSFTQNYQNRMAALQRWIKYTLAHVSTERIM